MNKRPIINRRIPNFPDLIYHPQILFTIMIRHLLEKICLLSHLHSLFFPARITMMLDLISSGPLPHSCWAILVKLIFHMELGLILLDQIEFIQSMSKVHSDAVDAKPILTLTSDSMEVKHQLNAISVELVVKFPIQQIQQISIHPKSKLKES